MGDLNQDPSMEEILASIKRVIAEEGRAPAGPSRAARRSPTASQNVAPPPASEDVLELDDPVSDEDGLISQGAAAASRQSLAALAAMRQSGEEAYVPSADHGPLEAVVRDMLKPMLKDWLDEHLPELVEELVTREIARITGRSL